MELSMYHLSLKPIAIAGKIPDLSGFDKVRSEVNYGKNSRIDLLLERANDRCFVEVKNCTLVSGRGRDQPEPPVTL